MPARPVARAVTRRNTSAGSARSMRSRCRRRPNRRCSAISAGGRCGTAASRVASAPDGRYIVTTDGPDGKLARVRSAAHVRRVSAAAIPRRTAGRPGAGTAGRMGRAPEGAGRPALVPPVPDEEIAHGDELHWTRRQQNWNFMCADCHSTNVGSRYDAGHRHVRHDVGGDQRRVAKRAMVPAAGTLHSRRPPRPAADCDAGERPDGRRSTSAVAWRG